MKIHRDIEQGSRQWDDLRLGRFGGTDAALFLVNGKNEHDIGAGLEAEIIRKVAARYLPDELEKFSSQAMERGNELEPIARGEYEDETFCTVETIGYISEGDWLGVSPDGLVGEDGAIEIKCPLGPEFLRYQITDEMDKSHYAQVQWLLWISGRKWCDYVVYHPAAYIIVKRIEPDQAMHDIFKRKTEYVLNKISIYVSGIEVIL